MQKSQFLVTLDTGNIKIWLTYSTWFFFEPVFVRPFLIC